MNSGGVAQRKEKMLLDAKLRSISAKKILLKLRMMKRKMKILKEKFRNSNVIAAKNTVILLRTVQGIQILRPELIQHLNTIESLNSEISENYLQIRRLQQHFS